MFCLIYYVTRRLNLRLEVPLLNIPIPHRTQCGRLEVIFGEGEKVNYIIRFFFFDNYQIIKFYTIEKNSDLILCTALNRKIFKPKNHTLLADSPKYYTIPMETLSVSIQPKVR